MNFASEYIKDHIFERRRKRYEDKIDHRSYTQRSSCEIKAMWKVERCELRSEIVCRWYHQIRAAPFDLNNHILHVLTLVCGNPHASVQWHSFVGSIIINYCRPCGFFSWFLIPQI